MGNRAFRVQRQAREGTTRFEETVRVPPALTDGVYRGDVERTVVAPASDTQPEETIHRDTVAVEFDPDACVVRLPHTFAFVAGEAAAPQTCQGPPPRAEAVDPLPADRVAEIRDRYLERINDTLNGWYAVRLEGDGCESACAGRDIPIRVEASAATGGAADTTITLVNRGGRADAATICVGDYDDGTVTHEGGHQVLGAGDEYRERDASVRARVPQWARVERVRRDDWSYMGRDNRFSLFHERHFAHVPAFLRSVFPGCRARLVELARPVVPDFRISFGGGYAYINDASGVYLDLGLEMGVPLSRLREWELILGVHGGMLGQIEDDRRSAWLLGARLGLEHTWTPSAGGFRVGGFGELGYGWFEEPREPGEPRSSMEGMPYAELGLGLGYRTGGSPGFSIGAEFAGGSSFGTGRIGDPGAELSGDDEALRWLRAGARAAIEF
ncbi:MAG TPA: hypothetical protein VHG51_05610 [Longimicrobiaceae bacterium]|nr:hypothetical protein [Longimicrobiaceae bacterium]